MIRDRGVIKWNSLMLPEHVAMLREWASEDQQEVRKPLDEQKLELLNEIVIEAMRLEKEVMFTYFRNHRFEQVIGKIHSYNILEKDFRVVEREGKRIKIFIEDIQELVIVED
ncbi:YolD-like family protein [Bacillus niameyensis]|uniref:YolD-like family protein n=1 Tax=Bacillus niameyensis TaxID=1522308 RepID=UPI00084121BB|nr:YolD-like family protein [Bacillus niameyensis]